MDKDGPRGRKAVAPGLRYLALMAFMIACLSAVALLVAADICSRTELLTLEVEIVESCLWTWKVGFCSLVTLLGTICLPGRRWRVWMLGPTGIPGK